MESINRDLTDELTQDQKNIRCIQVSARQKTEIEIVKKLFCDNPQLKYCR